MQRQKETFTESIHSTRIVRTPHDMDLRTRSVRTAQRIRSLPHPNTISYGTFLFRRVYSQMSLCQSSPSCTFVRAQLTLLFARGIKTVFNEHSEGMQCSYFWCAGCQFSDFAFSFSGSYRNIPIRVQAVLPKNNKSFITWNFTDEVVTPKTWFGQPHSH